MTSHLLTAITITVLKYEKGKVGISKVIFIRNTNDKNSFIVQQAGNKLFIRLSDIKAGRYNFSLINTNGQLIQTTVIQHDGNDVVKEIELKTNVVKGVYRATLNHRPEIQPNLIDSIKIVSMEEAVAKKAASSIYNTLRYLI